MEDCFSKLTDTHFQNWLKSMLAVNITRDGIEDQVKNVIGKFHEDVLNEIFEQEQIENSDFCSSCSIENILPCQTKFMCSVKSGACKFHCAADKKYKPCPKNVCHKFRDKIRQFHRHKFPSWSNTCPHRWCTDSWEIAKCCMPPSAYSKVMSSNETDLNGLLSVLMNHSRFENEVDEAACIEARECGNKVRHCANLLFDDTEVHRILQTFITCLSSSQCLADNVTAKQAVTKLEKLKNDTLPIALHDVTNVLRDAIDEHTRLSLQSMEDAQLKVIDQIEEKFMKEKNVMYQSIKNAFAAVKVELEQKALDMRKEYSSMAPEQQKYQALKIDLKEDLLDFNLNQHGTISLSPLIEENDILITEFYVQPTLHCIDNQTSAFESERLKSKKIVNCYRDIFFKYTNRCKEIYLTSDAGVGKTAFGKWLAVTWCLANEPNEDKKRILSKEDMDIMKSFDFVFILPLRDSYKTECDVDNMIYIQIISQLSRSSLYTLDFLQNILHRENCLIVLDGLDEWSHPEIGQTDCRIRAVNIPHRKPRKLCTILTTTRPWKFETASIKLSQIGQHIEMTGLDDIGAEQLIKNVLSKLKGECVLKTTKSLEDFNRELNHNNIQELKYTPVILMHLICLWCDNQKLGKSKCDIFINIIELHISHAENKWGESFFPRNDKMENQSEPTALWPSRSLLKDYQSLLLALGKLAFETLFKQTRECSLLFDSSVAKEHLKGDLFDIAMKTGLLAHSTSKRKLTKKLSMVFFPHKTYQEFFAALFIQSLQAEFSESLQNVMTVCNTVENILEMSNVFIFMAGLCPETLNVFFQKVIKQATEDELTQLYRSRTCSANYWDDLRVIRNLQDMTVACMQEFSRNNPNMNKTINLSLEDFFLDGHRRMESYGSEVEALLKGNQKCLKSIHINDVESPQLFCDIVNRYELGTLQCLQKLDLWVTLETQSLDRILSASACSLKHLILHSGHWQKNRFVEHYFNISNDSLSAIQTMSHLESLSVWDLVFTHNQLENLLQDLNQKTRLKQIGIGDIKCKDHGDDCNGHILDLSLHSQLRILQINLAPFSTVNVSVSSLEECHFGEFVKPGVLRSLFSCLQGSPKLYTFGGFGLHSDSDIESLVETLPLLDTLRHLLLNRVDFGSKDLKLFPKVKLIEYVKLKRVSISSRAIKTFFEEIQNYDHSVRVELVGCDVKPADEYMCMKENMNESSNYFVIEDRIDQWKRSVFKVRTN
ncbi:uncharacterized protein LOC123563941 [Mercenaria mercenaria]|uniref:uncharacterized protein LOC123563941 n=1 Tax=Mercenaria mercenaria TaxID=6596 RepID=UPI00234F2A4D|nr:uncharacterized protein LOC123563941 [Mercenaria mercenaria]XP_045213054.2 uncharacterized protein LOC123563941 [Mercenaria mercenaria]